MDQEQQRAKWRAAYARKFPEGFKRRRNAAQRAKQRASQNKYNNQPGIIHTRRLQSTVREYLAGYTESAQAMVGCSVTDLRKHLDASLGGAPVMQWRLAYIRHPREFNLDNKDEQAICFHYTNMYARPLRLKPDSSLCPFRPAPSQAGSSRAGLSEQV